MEIYELVIPKDNLLRQIKELVDFSFIYDELLANYCLDNGRNAVPPIRMFKYLLLKSIYDLSDVDVVERSKYDMSFKYFLDMAPEDEVINPSSLTKFRKLRLKDMNLLDMLIAKTVQLALEKGIIKSKSIIVDATHTKSRYNQKTPRQVLQEQSKNLRRSIYEIDETMKEKFPDKNTEDSLEKELKYCKQLIDVVKGNEEICSYPKVQEKLNLLEESVTDDMEHLEISKDEDSKTGHKTADTSFFGYKTHIAMTEERIITAATITSGEKTDGKELPKLIQKSKAAGIQIESVIGDMAYATTLSFLIGLFEQINRPETDFEKVFEIMMETEQNDDEFTIEQMWTLFSYLLKYDLGYIRYDIDPEHENGKLHPLYHLDICLDNSATYKIGLNQEIRFDNFKDILDTATESWYIYRGQN